MFVYDIITTNGEKDGKKVIHSKDIEKGNKVAQATVVGKLVAEKAKAAGVEVVVFDRNGYLYHGRVKALANSAREGGLKF